METLLKNSKHICSEKLGRMIVAKLDTGVDVVEGIEALCDEYRVNAGIIVCCFGSIGKAGFEYLAVNESSTLGANRSDPVYMEGPFQLLGGQGTISVEEETGKRKVHIHAMVSNHIAHIFGGHLLPGKNPVLRTCEVAIQELQDIKMLNRFNPKTQSKQLVFE